MKKLLAVSVLTFLTLIISSNAHSLDSLALGDNDARNDTPHTECTLDSKIQSRLNNVSSSNPLILTWPFRGKISNYNAEVEERTHKILLGYGAWWVNDDGLNADGSDKGEGHWCWDGNGRSVTNMSDCGLLHSGIDINRKVDEADNDANDPDEKDQTDGKTVFSVYPGKVIRVHNWGSKWKWYVIVAHDSNGGSNYNFTTIYAHLDNVSVSENDYVNRESKIGEVADLTNSSARDRDHLHFGLLMLGHYDGTSGGIDNLSRGVISYSPPSVDQADNQNNKFINPSPLCFGAANKVIKWVDRPLFPDVEMDAWYYPYLLRVHNLGTIQGYPDGTFRPDTTVNQVEFLKMVVETSGQFCCDDCGGCSNCITCEDDPAFPSTEWFYKYVRAALNAGWLDDVVYFIPNLEARRYWVARVLVHSVGGQGIECPDGATSPFVDIDSSNICNREEAYAWRAQQIGVVEGHCEKTCAGTSRTGTKERRFCGDYALKRAEAAAVVERAFIKESTQITEGDACQ